MNDPSMSDNEVEERQRLAHCNHQHIRSFVILILNNNLFDALNSVLHFKI